MGAWSVGITGNDTAADLQYEYEAAFSRLPPAEAVERLDAYVRRELDLIRRGIGLELYTDASQRRRREKVLADFQKKLCGPQPPPKLVHPQMRQKPVFHAGDVVALRISTAGKPYYSDQHLPETVFYEADGSWMLVQKIRDQVSWQSRVVPEVRDLWPEFALLDFCGPHLPGVEEISGLPVLGVVTGDGKMSSYGRWNARVIGRSTGRVPPVDRCFAGVFFLGDGIGNCQKEVACLYRWGTCLKNIQ